MEEKARRTSQEVFENRQKKHLHRNRRKRAERYHQQYSYLRYYNKNGSYVGIEEYLQTRMEEREAEKKSKFN